MTIDDVRAIMTCGGPYEITYLRAGKCRSQVVTIWAIWNGDCTQCRGVPEGFIIATEREWIFLDELVALSPVGARLLQGKEAAQDEEVKADVGDDEPR